MASRALRRLSAVAGPRASARTLATALATKDDKFLKYASPVPEPYNIRVPQPETKVTTLPNGLRVATETVPFAETATVGVWIDAGSRFETDASNGTAHFLEHMFFKGTAKRSTRALEEEVENMGGHLNAYTSREQTAYYAKGEIFGVGYGDFKRVLLQVFKKDVPAAVDILSDMLQNSALNEADIERERGVILREMQEVEGMTDEVIFDQLHATAFQYSPLGRTILGPADNIRRLTQGDLRDYIATHYTAPRMVVSAAGAVDHEEVVKLASSAFAKLPTDPTTAAQLVAKEPSVFTGSEVRIRDDDLPLLHFAIAYKGSSWTDADSIPLMVIQSILGSWDKGSFLGKNAGSELAQLVAANSLVENYSTFNTNYSDSGLFGVYATTTRDKAQDAAWAIMDNITRLIYRPSEAEVVRARNQLKASLLLHLDGTSPIAEDIGRQLLTYGRRIPLAELFARIDAVDTDTVRAVADRFFYDKDIAVASLGPSQYLPDYNWLRRRTYWLSY